MEDAEYREAVETVSGIPGCRSSKDLRLTDRHIDTLLAYFEAIFWRKIDLGQLNPNCKPDAIFRQRHYWAQKNAKCENSRQRYAASLLGREIAVLEGELADLGFGAPYCSAIEEKVTAGRTDPYSLHLYKAALERTIRAKRNKGLMKPA